MPIKDKLEPVNTLEGSVFVHGAAKLILLQMPL
jgi:hypothetical protein